MRGLWQRLRQVVRGDSGRSGPRGSRSQLGAHERQQGAWHGTGDRLPRLSRAAHAQRPVGRCSCRCGGGLRGDLLVGPPLTVEQRPRRVRFRMVVVGCGHGGRAPAVRSRERARAALSPCDHRPSHRHAERDVPRPSLGGAGVRRGVQRARDRRAVAAQGRAQRPSGRVRRGHPCPAARRGGQLRRSCAGRSRSPVDTACDTATVVRCGVERGDGGLVRRLGRRLAHRPRRAREAAASDRRLPRGWRLGQARASPGQGRLGSHRGRGLGRRVRPMAHERARPGAHGRPRDRGPVRGGRGPCPTRRRASSVLVSADPKQHVAWLHEMLDLGVDELFIHHVPREQRAFIDTFAAEVLPEVAAR